MSWPTSSQPHLNHHRARLQLSLICEPGDPRLPELLAEHGPARLVDLIKAGRAVGGRPFPVAWVHAAQSVDTEAERAGELAEAAGLRWITPADKTWPERLNDLDH